jgi:type II secretory pathway pseudopilin PulG
MRAWLRQRIDPRDREAGITLIELLVATTMSIVVVGAATSMLITAVKDQPDLSKQSQNISTARWILERLTREIRNGVVVDSASSSSVSFQTYVRHTTCGGTTPLSAGSPAIKCEVTYSCTVASCSRTEAAPGIFTGTPKTIFSGIDRSEVFCYVPSSNTNPSTCGPPKANVAETTYIGATLHMPSPKGRTGITAHDGASLSNAILTN